MHQKERLNKELHEIKQSVKSSNHKKKRILEKLPFKASPSLEASPNPEQNLNIHTPKKSKRASPEPITPDKEEKENQFEFINSSKLTKDEPLFYLEEIQSPPSSEPPIKIQIVQPLKLSEKKVIHQFTPNTNHRTHLNRNEHKYCQGAQTERGKRKDHLKMEIKPLRSKILSKKLDLTGYQNLRKTKKKLINKKLGFIRMNSIQTDQKHRRGRLSERRYLGSRTQGLKDSVNQRKQSKSRKRGKKKSKRRGNGKEILDELDGMRGHVTERNHSRKGSALANKANLSKIVRSMSRDNSSNFTFRDKSLTLKRNISVRLGSLASKTRRIGIKKQLNPSRTSRRKSSTRSRKTRTKGIKSRTRGIKNSSNNKSRSKSKILNKDFRNSTSKRYREKLFSRHGRAEKSPILHQAFLATRHNIPNFLNRKVSHGHTRRSINSYENHFGRKGKSTQFEAYEHSPRKELLSSSKKANHRNVSTSKKLFNFNDRSYSTNDYLTPKYKDRKFFNSRKSSAKRRQRKTTRLGESSQFKQVNLDQTEMMQTYFTKENEYNYIYLKKMSNMLKKSKVKKQRVNEFTLKIGKLHKKLNLLK